jgi:creatinine amidohydrolase
MQFGERTWKEIEELTDRVVVLPLASCEQHGHHLPLLTDTMICQEIVSRAEAELGDAALFLPTLWVGASDHHRAFPGTVSLSSDVYKQVLMDCLESLIGSGFRRIFLLSAHGGNHIPGCSAVYEVQLRHKDKPDLWLAFGEWMTIAARQIADLEDVEQKKVIHACEIETSMILRLQPKLVKLEAARGAQIPFESAFYCPDFSRPSRVTVPRSFEQLSRTGAFARPETATAEKGESLFDAAVGEIVAFVREFATWSHFDPQ